MIFLIAVAKTPPTVTILLVVLITELCGVQCGIFLFYFESPALSRDELLLSDSECDSEKQTERKVEDHICSKTDLKLLSLI